MGVKKISRERKEDGQSVLEFLLLLPMMVALVVILVKVNTVIQISIVNQQYARAQALWLAFNSPFYPTLTQQQDNLVPKGYSQMVLGVSENQVAGTTSPRAATHYIARKRGQPEGDAKAEPRERAVVRVRDTVTLCTRPYLTGGPGGGSVPILDLGPVTEGFRPRGPYNLGESSRFDFCGGPMRYLSSSDGDA